MSLTSFLNHGVVKATGNFFYAKTDFSESVNDVPVEFENKIINGNSLQTLKQLPNNCVDIVLTSPPYNFDMGYDMLDDKRDFNDYFNELFPIFDECIRVLKYGGRIIVNIQPRSAEYIPTHHILTNFLIAKGLIWRNEIIWNKNQFHGKACSWGSYASPSSPYLKGTCEFVTVYSKGALKKTGKKENIDITEDEFKDWVNGFWTITPETRMKKFGHPAMFPEKLVERCLKLFSYKDDFIVDPFNGAGTTTLVSHKTGRRYLGIDISKDYCETAQQRLNGITKN